MEETLRDPLPSIPVVLPIFQYIANADYRDSNPTSASSFIVSKNTSSYDCNVVIGLVNPPPA
jgi:hypothetical protein